VQLAAAVALSSPVLAQDDEPSLDFLEYLGSWEEGDEAWYVEVQIEESDGDGDGSDVAADHSPKEARVEQEND
jgi:hypothetical protein